MRLILFPAFALLASLAAAPLAAQNMNAEDFYQRAKKLEAKGMGAMFSADLKPIMKEAKAAGAAVRARRAALEAKGQKLYCPPAKSGLSGPEFLRHMEKIPQAERQRMTMIDAYQRIAIARFPCT